MFCSFCGAQIPDNLVGCPNCGSTIIQNGAPGVPVVNPVNNYEMQKNAVRTSEINSLANTIAHFEKITDKFAAYDEASAAMKHYGRGPKNTRFVFAGILLGIMVFFIAMMVATDTVFIQTVFVMIMFFGTPAAILIVWGVLVKKRAKAKHKQWEDEYIRLSNEIYAHYNAYPNCPVGMEYINPRILHNIMQILRSGRADTIKESLNVAVADAGAAQVQQYLKDMKKIVEETRAEATIAAVFAAGSFFK